MILMSVGVLHKHIAAKEMRKHTDELNTRVEKNQYIIDLLAHYAMGDWLSTNFVSYDRNGYLTIGTTKVEVRACGNIPGMNGLFYSGDDYERGLKLGIDFVANCAVNGYHHPLNILRLDETSKVAIIGYIEYAMIANYPDGEDYYVAQEDLASHDELMLALSGHPCLITHYEYDRRKL